MWRQYRGYLGVAAVMGVVTYPIFVRPLLESEDYRKMQRKYRPYKKEDTEYPGLPPRSEVSRSK